MARESSKTSGTVETPFLLFKWICDMRQLSLGSVNFSPVQSHFLSTFHKSNLSATHKYCLIAFKNVGFRRNSDPAF